MIRGYVQHRQMFPASSAAILASSGLVTRFSRAAVAVSQPGVQYPHCIAPCSSQACCTGCSTPSSARPSTVVIRWPAASADGRDARGHRAAADQHRAGAAGALAAAELRAGDAQVIPQHLEQAPAVVRRHRPLGAVDDDRYCHRGSFLGRVFIGITTGIVFPREHRRVRQDIREYGHAGRAGVRRAPIALGAD